MRFIRQYLEQIPIPNKIKPEQSEKIIQKVEILLSLNQQLSVTLLDSEKQQIQHTILRVEKEVDKMVCEVYGLGEEDVRIIEQGMK